jgi:hypothetical protein
LKTPRLKKLCWWLAGAYLGWSLYVYFGTLASEAHSWWPVFLMPVIFPWSWIYEIFCKEFLNGWLAPDPRTAPAWVWTALDRIAGAFYIGFGTLWLWFVGKMVSFAATKMLPPRQTTPGLRPEVPDRSRSARK